MTRKTLDDLPENARLFTYKVMFDGGTAPNPFGGVCTLAICKPAIRRVAEVGDLIVGLAPGNEGQIVYCMKVTDKMSWKDYITHCTSKATPIDRPEYAGLSQKVPRITKDQGVCIWRNAEFYEEVRPTHSHHTGINDFKHDVLNGKSVLLSTMFWYFGKGNEPDVRLPDDLKQIIPGRGHRSNGNNIHKDYFVRIFNDLLRSRGIHDYGKHGQPKDAPEAADKSECARCRIMQAADDQESEEES